MEAVSKGLRVDESLVHLTCTDVYTFPILQLWAIFVLGTIVQSRFFICYLLLGLMHSAILQIRLYALYNRSRRILFILVLGFIIQTVDIVVSNIRLTIFNCQSLIYMERKMIW